MPMEGTPIPFGLMKFYKNLKGKACFIRIWKESSHTWQVFLRGAFPLHNQLESPSVVLSLTSLSPFPTSNPSEVYLRIIKPWPKVICEFLSLSWKKKMGCHRNWQNCPHFPTAMSAELKPQCWEQLQKQLQSQAITSSGAGEEHTKLCLCNTAY